MPNTIHGRNERTDRAFLAHVATQLHELDFHSTDSLLADQSPISLRRRADRARRIDESPVGTLTLTEADGVLRWDLDHGLRGSPRAARRQRFGPSGSADRIREQLGFRRLESSQIGKWLETLDAKLTPVRGLRRLGAAGLEAVGAAPSQGKILLLVHGTFSSGDHLLAEFQATPAGRELLARARREYDAVLTFDHATISVSPILNAIDLARALAGTNASIDLVAHSRGGIVARSFLEHLAPHVVGPRRLILVGSPLDGTSLASPPRLRAALDLLTNVSRALAVGAITFPIANAFFIAAAGLLRVIASITSAASKTPLLDAAVAMIPGLAAQSRVENNAELRRLRIGPPAPVDYSAIIADFEPDTVGWAFWKVFNSPGARVADWAADLVFEGANDLVVDTASMTVLDHGLRLTGTNQVLDFGKTSQVHHVNYFRQKRTLQFIAARFAIPP